MWVDDTRKKLNLPIIGSVKKGDESNLMFQALEGEPPIMEW